MQAASLIRHTAYNMCYHTAYVLLAKAIDKNISMSYTKSVKGHLQKTSRTSAVTDALQGKSLDGRHELSITTVGKTYKISEPLFQQMARSFSLSFA